MTLLLNAKFWIAVALSALLAFTHFASYRAGRADVREQFDAYKLAQAESRILADRAATLATTKALNEAHAQTVAAESAAATASDAAGRLRVRLAAYAKAASGSGPGVKDTATLDLLIGVFQRTDDAAGQLAAYADKLKAAGLACERISAGK